MIETLLKELKETWGYTTEELNDIRSKMEDIASSYYWEGINDTDYKFRQSYGKKEDNE
jgi:hypothetical protein